MGTFLPNHHQVPVLLGVAATIYAATSLFWSSGDLAVNAAQISVLAGAFFLGVWMRNIKEVWVYYETFVCLCFAVSFGYWLLYDSNELLNPNILGCALALGLAAAIGYRHWVFLAVVPVGLWFCASRAAWAGAAAAVFVGFWHTYRATGWCLALLSILGATLAPKISASESLWHRLGVWQDTLNNLSFWGAGWGAWADAYHGFALHRNMTLMFPPHAYNDILELLFDLGIGSVLIWALVAVSLEGRDRTDRLVLIVFFVLSLTYFPLTFVGPMVALSLGHLSQTKEKSPWLAGS